MIRRELGHVWSGYEPWRITHPEPDHGAKLPRLRHRQEAAAVRILKKIKEARTSAAARGGEGGLKMGSKMGHKMGHKKGFKMGHKIGHKMVQKVGC